MSTLTEADLKKLGLMADSLDNGLAAGLMPLPQALLLEGLTGIVTKVRDGLKAFVNEKCGYDVWGIEDDDDE